MDQSRNQFCAISLILRCRANRLIRQTVGEPDPFKVRYRESLRELMGEIIRDNRLDVNSPPACSCGPLYCAILRLFRIQSGRFK